jgi:hypothetical protein
MIRGKENGGIRSTVTFPPFLTPDKEGKKDDLYGDNMKNYAFPLPFNKT